MDKPKLNFQDKLCISMFTTKEMTVLLLACAHTYRMWQEGKFESPAMNDVPPEKLEAMMEMAGELRPKLLDMIGEAIGPENNAKMMAYAEQMVREMEGGKSH